ncbi:MAG: hypothetical protein E7580_01300 [Ruminococcaceae bacterium]|nr:hypothetical protein [Oscillospiraceae bacterium]
MKKSLLFLSLSLLLCTLLSFGAQGASKGRMSLSGELTDLKPGSTVELTVLLNQNPGVTSLRCTVGFDPKVLKFVSAKGTKTLPDFSFEEREDGVLLRWNSETDTVAAGEVAKLTLRVKKNALFGDSAVTLSVSEALFDAQNSRGEAVPFDTAGMSFTLSCPHDDPEQTVELEPTFETEGILKQTCPVCGNADLLPLLPEVESADGRVKVAFAAGEFSNGNRVDVFIDPLFAVTEEKEARKMLGSDMLRAFRIRILKDGEPYIPIRDCTVSLRYDAFLPEGTVLYLLMDGGALQPKFTREGSVLTFSYSPELFALVARTPYEEPEVPTTTAKPTTATVRPTTTEDPVEKARRKDLFLIAAGCVTLLLCGTGMILLLGRRKRF